jgi:predicted house-cleaning noncanonical NTP pyrophosphatase (MazG superfamily)
MTSKPAKLVRDRIPEIVRASGKSCTVTQLSAMEYRQALREKLVEEANEVADAEEKSELLKELADVCEVLDALMAAYNISGEQVKAIQQQRREQRGGFEKGWMLHL